MNQQHRVLRRAFVLWAGLRDGPGLHTTLNSIYAWHGRDLRVMMIDLGLTAHARRSLEHHPVPVEWIDSPKGDIEERDAGHCLAQALVRLEERVRCACLVAAGAVLASNHNDVFVMAEYGEIQASAAGLVCLDLARHGELLRQSLKSLTGLQTSHIAPPDWWKCFVGLLASESCFSRLPETEWTLGEAVLIPSAACVMPPRVEVRSQNGEIGLRFVGHSSIEWWKQGLLESGRLSPQTLAVFQYFAELVAPWPVLDSRGNFPIFLLMCEGPNPRRERALREVVEHFGREPYVVTGVSKRNPALPHRCLPLAAQARLSPGECACATGHAEMLLRFLATDAPWGLFLEDDVSFLAPASRFRDCGSLLEKNAPGWGWLICGRNDVWFGESPPEPFPPGHDCHWENGGMMRVVSATFGAYCYLASRAGAVHLLNCLVPLRAPIDVSTRWPRGAAAYQVVEALARTAEGSPSLING